MRDSRVLYLIYRAHVNTFPPNKLERPFPSLPLCFATNPVLLCESVDPEEMVVEAAQQQYPSSNAFLPDFCSSRSRPSDCYKSTINVKEEFLSIPMMHAVDKMQFGFGIQLMEGEEQPILSQGGGMVLNYPHSDLTCIARSTSSKKRSRDDQSSQLMPLSSLQQHPLLRPNITIPSRLYASAGATTSGRPADAPPLAQELVANLHHQQDTELDSLIRLHTERLRMGLWESRKRHCAALLSTLEQQPATVQLKQKEAELAIGKRRNAELLEKVERMAAESQMWFSAAKNNEAVASSLRTALQQLLLAAPQTGKEGCGDNDGGASFPADDAQSCCVEPPAKEVRRENEELRWRRACRGCGEREACVLLLPCRHLCVCTDCENSIRTCPVCCSDKSASIRVSME